MIVYIEYVLIDNFVIDYLLLSTTFKTTGDRVQKLRVGICSLFGAIFSLLFPLLNIGEVLLIAIKSLFGLLLVIFGTPFISMKKVYINSAIFMGYTFLLGGSIIAICNIFNIEKSETLIALIILPAHFLLKAIFGVVMYIYRKKGVASLTYDVSIVYKDKILQGKGFLDTGNGAYFKDKPVCFCSKKMFFKLINNFEDIKKLDKICINTALGEKQKFILPISAIKIYINGKENIFNNVVFCVAENIYSDETILHPALFNNLVEDNINESIR